MIIKSYKKYIIYFKFQYIFLILFLLILYLSTIYYFLNKFCKQVVNIDNNKAKTTMIKVHLSTDL